MGAWGPAIFSDDLACDIRDDFKDLIGDGKSSEDATEIMINEYQDSISDTDEGHVFWLSLALTQWNIGRLLDHVKKKAISIIDNGIGLDNWKEDINQYKKRLKVYEKLKDKLNSKQPEPKIIKKRFKENTPYNIGDVISYETKSGKYILMRIIDHQVDKGGKSPVCELLDFYDDHIPDTNKLMNMRIMKSKCKIDCTNFILGSVSKREFPEDRVKLVAEGTQPQNIQGSKLVFLWRSLDEDLLHIFSIK